MLPTLTTDSYVTIFRCVSAVANSRKDDSNIVQIIRYIDNNLNNSDINLDMVAIKFGYNSNYLSRLFKQTMNVGFVEYITRHRVECAKKLLVKTNESIKSIAEKCRLQ